MMVNATSSLVCDKDFSFKIFCSNPRGLTAARFILIANSRKIVFNDWQMSIKNRKLLDIIYLDFQKAFDSLVHNKIIAKLSAYGIRYELLCWIEAFLTGRLQMVLVDDMLSSSIPVSSGVVQGSVLGPLIFILCIDDIVDCLDSNEICPTSCSIFADDLKLYCAYDSINDVCSLSNTIRNIEYYCGQLNGSYVLTRTKVH